MYIKAMYIKHEAIVTTLVPWEVDSETKTGMLKNL